MENTVKTVEATNKPCTPADTIKVQTVQLFAKLKKAPPTGGVKE
jgi:hypothetical protein